MTSEEILSKLPYKTFLFVDKIIKITENGVGTFTFDRILIFYKGHFKDNPLSDFN
jgi:3-hydroxyacyl-[acyl-carrier-protein] dehydratase